MNNTNKEFVIGISGHRDLNPFEINSYKKDLIEILNVKLDELYNNYELVILSPLADGADRLIVEVAQELGIKYKVLLPIPKELYEKDFNEKSKKEFNLLLKKAQNIKTIDMCDGCTINNIDEYNENRDKQYKRVGEQVVENSDLMIFMWDGEYNGKTGGTADILEYTKKYKKDYIIISVQRDKTEPISKEDKIDIIRKSLKNRYLNAFIFARYLNLGRKEGGQPNISLINEECNIKEIKKIIQEEINDIMENIVKEAKKMQFYRNITINLKELEDNLLSESYNKAKSILKNYDNLEIKDVCIKKVIKSIYKSGKGTIYNKKYFIKNPAVLCDYFNLQITIWEKDFYNKEHFKSSLINGIFDKPKAIFNDNEQEHKKNILGEYKLLTKEEKDLLVELNKKLEILTKED